jgi:exodeoxyribonuclease VII large subunit
VDELRDQVFIGSVFFRHEGRIFRVDARPADAIARGIRELNDLELRNGAASSSRSHHLDRLDLLIVGRGGGSLEDLWAFNEETVARAIAASRLPVISAVGHEKDVTISDLVADLRAPTPTKAAEMVLAQRRACLERFLRALEETAFTEPEIWLEELKENLIELEEQLVEGLREPLIAGCQRLQVLQRDLLSCSPQALILHQAERLHRFQSSLVTGFVHALEQATSHFLGLVGRLNALSPLQVLARGYSITFDAQGRIVKLASSVRVGDLIETKLHRGRLKSKVESTETQK